jgi:hypothetical protein
MKILCLCSLWLQRQYHVVAQTLQTMDQVSREMVLVALVEVKISQVVVENLLGKHVIDRHQDLMGYGHRGALVPAPGLETAKLVPFLGQDLS